MLHGAFDEDGRCLVHLEGAVPARMPQTAQAVEYMAVQEVMKVLMGKAVIYGDCANVVRDATKSAEELSKSVYAGAILEAQRRDKYGSLADGMINVKAHAKHKDCTTLDEAWLAICNGAVDKMATVVRTLHPEPCPEDAEKFERLCLVLTQKHEMMLIVVSMGRLW